MFLNIYLKELKDCFRDRRTLLLTVLLPIVMMTGLTLFYENMISDEEGKSYKLAVDESFGNEEQAIFAGFENIEIIKATDPEEALKEGKAQAALLVEADFMEKINEGEQTTISLVGDSFSQNSSTLMSVVTNAMTVFEKQVIAERLAVEGTDPSLIQPFMIEQKEMSEEDPNINLLALLIPMILAIAITVGAAPAASELFAGEKEKKTMEALLMSPVNRSTLLFAKWLTISTIGSVTGIVTLAVVALEISFLTENLKKAVSFGDNAVIIIIIAILASILYAMIMASALMLTSIIGKTLKESQSYSSPIMMIAAFPSIFISTVGINELSSIHFAIPVLNLFSLLKELLFGIVNYEHILIAIAGNVGCMLVVLIIGRILFLKDKWVMN